MTDTLESLAGDTILLTVNNRLAREMMRRYAQGRIAAGQRVWDTPAILPWSAWLRSQYEALVDAGYTERTLLSPHQERLLWEQVVRDSPEGGALLRPAAAARSAQRTWQLLYDWRISPESLDYYPDEQTRLFVTWSWHFEELCRQARGLSAAELGALLGGALQDGTIVPPRRIRLAGFDSLTPQQQRLRENLAEAGCDIEEWHEAEQTAATRRLALHTREQEYLAAADWAREQLAAHPGARLAIVSARLQEDRDGLERSLRQVLDPAGFLPGRPPAPLFNVSLGRPLSEYPLVAHLLLGLRLAMDKPLSLHELGVLLRSPFIGGHAGEWLQRAGLDRRLREHGRPWLRRAELLYQAHRQSEGDAAYCPALVARLRQLQDLLDTLPREDSPNAWAGHLLKLIDTLGWPGEQPPDSSEYQQIGRLRDLISEFSTLARVRSVFRLGEAVSRLAQLCEETEFQPQAPDTPVQVLGMLEAAGLRFDGIWILGMDDQAWPPAPSPDPLIPVSLQREDDMPHASAERELHFARQIMERLARAAPQLWVSHALRDDDRELRPSPLIHELPEADAADPAGIQNPLYLAAARGPAPLPLSAVDKVQVPTQPTGGSGLLADQAACPFKAVAHHRLYTRALPEPSYAPDPRLIGNMVHQLLERIWQHLRDSQGLHACPPDELDALVQKLAAQTLEDLARQRPDLYGSAFRSLEKMRLGELALAWLAYERRREAPFRVVGFEQDVQTELVGLPLRARIDRIDELEDASRVIIDYKTGSRVGTDSWTGERPDEPQVPLYCISHPRVSAGLLAQVNRRQLKMHGLARAEHIAPGVHAYQASADIPDWDALLGHWRSQLELLAREILDGLARVSPKDAKACEYCDLPAFCRVRQLARADGDEQA